MDKQPILPLEYCEFDKKLKRLTVPSEFFGKPSEFTIKSNITGKTVDFVVIGEDDPLFDQDQWDGIQQLYRPKTKQKNVELCVIYDLI